MKTKSIVVGLLILGFVFSFLPACLFAQNSPWVNVKDAPYSAKGDGSTDDSAAIQKAINAGPNIIFPPGEYLIKKTINVPGYKKLTGYGATILGHTDLWNQYIFESSGSMGSAQRRIYYEGFLIELNGAKGAINFNKGCFDLVIRNMRITFGAMPPALEPRFVNLINSFNLRMENVSFTGSGKPDTQTTFFYVTSDSDDVGYPVVNNILLMGCSMTYADKGVVLDSSQGMAINCVNIINSIIQGCNYHVWLSNGTGPMDGIVLDGVHMENSNGIAAEPRGIYATTSSAYIALTVRDCHMTGMLYAFDLDGPNANSQLLVENLHVRHDDSPGNLFNVFDWTATFVNMPKLVNVSATPITGNGLRVNLYQCENAMKADTSIPNSASNTTYTNYGAAKGIRFVLPAVAVDGIELSFIVKASYILRIEPKSTSKIIGVPNLSLAPGGSISSATVGNSIRLRSGADGNWYVVYINGAWKSP